MRLEDKNRGSWQSFRGYRNAGWISGFLRLNPATPRTIFIQQNNNEGLIIPIHLRQGNNLPSRFKEWSPIKVCTRIMGRYNLQANRMEVKAMALDFDFPALNEMPVESVWMTNLPNGVEPSPFLPTFFGKAREINEVVAKDKANIVEIGGHVSGFMMSPARELENGRMIPKQMFMFVQQTENPLTAIPVRYKGDKVQGLREHVRIGHPVYVRAQLRVKHMPVPGSTPDENGVLQTYQYMIVDGNAFGQKFPNAAQPDIHVPRGQLWPEWAQNLARGGEDAVKKAILASAQKLRMSSEQIQNSKSSAGASQLESGIDELDMLISEGAEQS